MKKPRGWNSALPASDEPMKRTRLKRMNRKRMERLRAEQFGTDGKREWILGLPSVINGKMGWQGKPMTPAHVGGTRGAGAGPEMLAPLLWTEHIDFDGSMTDKRFIERHGISREAIRERARELETEWRELEE